MTEREKLLTLIGEFVYSEVANISEVSYEKNIAEFTHLIVLTNKGEKYIVEVKDI